VLNRLAKLNRVGYILFKLKESYTVAGPHTPRLNNQWIPVDG